MRKITPPRDLLFTSLRRWLNGTLSVLFVGYTPQSGDDYTSILTYGSRSGAFASISPSSPGPGLSWVPTYNDGTGSFDLGVL